MTAVLAEYAPLLLATLIIECALVAAGSPRAHRGRVVLACIGLNLFTHPAAELLTWWYRDPGLLTLEVLIILIEWIGYIRLVPVSAARGLRYALVANVLSAFTGIALANAPWV